MRNDTAVEWALRVLLFVIAVPSLYFGLHLSGALALLIGAALAWFGVLLIVIVLDDDGSPR